jgi:hypothetical protein
LKQRQVANQILNGLDDVRFRLDTPRPGTDHLLGREEACEADRCQTEDTKQADGFSKGGNALGDLGNSADEDTQHRNLILEALEVDLLEIVAINIPKRTGIETVLEGVRVAKGSAAVTLDSSGDGFGYGKKRKVNHRIVSPR